MVYVMCVCFMYACTMSKCCVYTIHKYIPEQDIVVRTPEGYLITLSVRLILPVLELDADRIFQYYFVTDFVMMI